MRRALSLTALSGLLAAAFLLAAAPEARADHWKKRHYYGPGWGPSWHYGTGWGTGWHHRHGRRHRHSGVGASIIFQSPPRTTYVERPPRVVYVEPQPEVVYLDPAPRQAEQRYCREVTKTVTIDGRPETAWGKACYQPDGTWEWVLD